MHCPLAATILLLECSNRRCCLLLQQGNLKQTCTRQPGACMAGGPPQASPRQRLGPWAQWAQSGASSAQRPPQMAAWLPRRPHRCHPRPSWTSLCLCLCLLRVSPHCHSAVDPEKDTSAPAGPMQLADAAILEHVGGMSSADICACAGAAVLLYHDTDVRGNLPAEQMKGGGGANNAQAWWQALHADHMAAKVCGQSTSCRHLLTGMTCT